MRSNYKILLLDTKPRNPNHYICLAIRDAFAAAGAEVHYVRYDDAIRTATLARCNVFLAFDGEEMHVDICRRLISLCDISVLWLTDDPYESPANLVASEMFDLVYTNDRNSVRRYGAKGRHLPFAGSKKYHFHEVLREASGLLRYDVLFCGVAWPNRTEILDPVLRSLKNKRFKIGLVPLQPGAPLPVPLLPSSYLWRTPPPELARLANRSRTTLALHRDFTSNPAGKSMASTPPPRLFELALAGTLQFYDSVVSETGDYFEPGTEVVSYDSPRDCIDKLEFYLSNPDERYAFAQAAQARALRLHTYECRARSILDDLESFAPAHQAKRKSAPPRPRILFVTHNIRPAGHFGGVEVYQERVAENLSEHYDIFFYYRDSRKGMNTYVFSDADYRPLEEVRFDNECYATSLSVSVKESVFATLLEAYEIRLIHFHHLINHPASLVLIGKLLNIPVVLTLHDFWVMCDSSNLIDYRKRYCDIPNQPDSACDICVEARLHKPAGTQAVRKGFFRRVLASADIVIGNTEGFHRILSRFYPEIAWSNKMRAIPVPLPQTESRTVRKSPGDRTRPHSGAPLRVAILGNFTYEKGGEAIVYALNQLRSAPVEFVIFGRVDQPYDQILPALNFRNVTVHGPYHNADLPALLKDMDLSVHLSMWPETYCIALSEAWKNDLIPIVSNIGALGERVVDGENGWKVPADQPSTFLDLMRRVLADPEVLARVKERTKKYTKLFESESEHVEKLRTIYADLLSNYPRDAPDHSSAKLQRSRLTLFDTGIVFNEGTWGQTFEAHREATAVAKWIVNSNNRYVSPLAERTAEIMHSQLNGTSRSSESVSREISLNSAVHLQGVAARIEFLEQSLHQNRMRVEAIYQSRIWRILCAGGNMILRFSQSGRHLRP